jgi:hypothetical protein
MTTTPTTTIPAAGVAAVGAVDESNLINARRHRGLSEASFLVVAGVGFEPT